MWWRAMVVSSAVTTAVVLGVDGAVGTVPAPPSPTPVAPALPGAASGAVVVPASLPAAPAAAPAPAPPTVAAAAAVPTVAPVGPLPPAPPEAARPAAIVRVADPSTGLPVPVAVPHHPYATEAVQVIGTIEIPAIGLADWLYEGVTLHNIDRGPSHWPGSALPGEPGNVVVGGHRSVRSHPFRHLDRLTAGDEVVFTVAGQRTVYRVTVLMIVDDQDFSVVAPTAEPTATLFACHPVGSDAQRLVVRLQRVA